MRIKAVLFDIDGTLVDSNEAHVEAWTEAFRSAGLGLDAAVIRPQIGKGTDQLVPALLRDPPPDLITRLGEAHGAIFKAKHLERVRPFPRARDLLVHVHATGRKIVLASSASRTEVDYYATLLDVADLLAAATSSDDVGQSKPAPDIFTTALSKLDGVRAQEAIAVGDTPYDAQAAARGGITSVCVRSGPFDDASLRAAGAVALYDDVASLLAGFDGSPLAG